MGFVILQYCKNRYITKYATIMQHQMSFMLAGEKLKVEHQLDHIQQMERFLVKIQAERIGMSERRFRDKTSNEWWLYGKEIIEARTADMMLDAVGCHQSLFNENKHMSIDNNIVIVSKCPLI